jgi:hypothetical protein
MTTTPASPALTEADQAMRKRATRANARADAAEGRVRLLLSRAMGAEEARDSARRHCGYLRERAHAAEARANAAEATLREREAEIERLIRFVDYVRMWRDRGPPHGDPVTYWGAVAHHPVVTARDRALAQPATPASHDEATR